MTHLCFIRCNSSQAEHITKITEYTSVVVYMGVGLHHAIACIEFAMVDTVYQSGSYFFFVKMHFTHNCIKLIDWVE